MYRAVILLVILSVMVVVCSGLAPAKAIPPPDIERARSSVPIEGQYAVSATIGREDSRYHSLNTAAGLELMNPAQSLRLVFSHNDVTLEVGSRIWRLGLVSWGYGGACIPVASSEFVAGGNRVEVDHGDVTEWYVNGPFGLQQGFTIATAPAGRADQPLELQLAAPEGLAARIAPDGQGLAWCDRNGNMVLSYTGLIVVDSGGKRLPVWLESRDGFLCICVDDSGATYPLTIDPWIQTAKLTASDGVASDRFGCSVAISGDTVVVGAYGDDSYDGSAYVFVKPASGWATGTETAKLTTSDSAGPTFGFSVAIDGDTVVVGGNGNDSSRGAAYVFVKPVGGWMTSTETAKLTASDSAAGDYLGISVAIDGDTVVAGAYGDDSLRGSAYVFVKPGGSWANRTETAKLTASDGAGSDEFGFSVAIGGDAIVVGAAGNGDTNKGAAYVFVKPGSGWATGTETAKLTASDAAASDYLGCCVAISGDTVVVGAYGDDSLRGSAYVFVKPGTGWANMTETAKLTASDGAAYDYLGSFVAISSDTVVGGAYRDDDNGSRSGSAYVFVKPGSGWATGNETKKLTASDGAASDHFGSFVAISSDTVVVGAYGDDSDKGSAYSFDRQTVETAAIYRVDTSGSVFADQTVHAAAFETGSADVAEWVEVSQPAAPGDVLALDPLTPCAYRLSRTICSSLVAGVVSTTPGVVLGEDGAYAQRALLALTGIVPVKVTNEGGPIQAGDLLVTSSTPGHAMRWVGPDPCPCALVGKALEPMTDGTGVILVLLAAH